MGQDVAKLRIHQNPNTLRLQRRVWGECTRPCVYNTFPWCLLPYGALSIPAPSVGKREQASSSPWYALRDVRQVTQPA